MSCATSKLHRHKRATTIQAYVRMHQQRKRYRRDTEAGKRAAARAAAAAHSAAAATVLQKHARRWHAQRKVMVRTDDPSQPFSTVDIVVRCQGVVTCCTSTAAVGTRIKAFDLCESTELPPYLLQRASAQLQAMEDLT